MKALKKTAIYTFVILALIISSFIIIGGGIGEKQQSIKLDFNDDEMLLFGHRGVRKYYPDNSFEGFKQAKILGFKAVEIDIHLSKDSIPVLFHDESCKKGLGVDKSICELSVSELKECKIVFKGKITENSVLTLDQYLTLFKDDFITYIDLKEKNNNLLLDSIASLIKRHNVYNRVLVANTDFLSIAYLENKYPKVNTVLEGFNLGKEWTEKYIPKDFKPDYYSSFATEINSEHIEWLKKNNLMSKRIVYGVDTSNYKTIADFGINMIIVDYSPEIFE